MQPWKELRHVSTRDNWQFGTPQQPDEAEPTLILSAKAEPKLRDEGDTSTGITEAPGASSKHR
jgi:hypothetical protein